ncbi:MAG: FAD binding domain-containing protein [Solirubrobacterales bacterium]
MKSAPFTLHRPDSVEAAVGLLGEHAGSARVLAGGQSLVPLMHRRLERPSHLVDINRVAGLDGVTAGAAGLAIGAGARQRAVETSAEVRRRWPLLAEALAEVAHPTIRNRGTVLGSLCHADPAAELPAAALALDARIAAAGAGGRREIGLGDFFLGVNRTSLEPGELAVELVVPALPPRTGCAWLEVSRRGGDLPVAGVAAVVGIDEDGACAHARVVCANAGPVPFDAAAQSRALVGERLGPARAAAAAREVAAACDPVDDYQGTAAERRRVLAALVRRALLAAAERAGSGR